MLRREVIRKEIKITRERKSESKKETEVSKEKEKDENVEFFSTDRINRIQYNCNSEKPEVFTIRVSCSFSEPCYSKNGFGVFLSYPLIIIYLLYLLLSYWSDKERRR